MHTIVLRIAGTGQPGLFGGEAEDRREPGGETVENFIQYGQGRAPCRIVLGIAIQTVLADIEIEGRQIDRAEIMQLPENPVEVVLRRTRSHQPVQAVQPVQNPTLQFRQVFHGHPRRRIVGTKVAQ